MNSPVSKSQPVLGNSRPPPRPEKVARVRATSVSVESPSPPQTTRKRTSSGVVQVEDAEPPPKKAENTRTLSDGALKKSKFVTNGRRKQTETDDVEAKEQKKIIDRFDSEAKTTCVNAFKESDSWD